MILQILQIFRKQAGLTRQDKNCLLYTSRSRNRLRGGGRVRDDDRDGRGRRSRNRLRDGDRVRGDAHEQAFSLIPPIARPPASYLPP